MNNFCVHMRPLLKRAFFFLVFVTPMLGCAHIKKAIRGPEVIVSKDKLPKYKSNDYVEHLAYLSKEITQNRQIKILKLSRKNEEYLTSIFRRVVANNELLVPSEPSPKFFLIKEKIPFIFSLPRYQFYISTGLIKKYFKNEALLVSALCFEIIKSGRNLYSAQRVYPIGFREIPQILALTKVETEIKLEIYKWTYFALRRAEYDATALLNWIQTQNKNTLDFSWQINDPRGVSREEFLFKNFLVTQGLNKIKSPEVNSSKHFYRFQETYR